ncbi:hypothetical protein NDU88_007581 [Pleurodeles waltl]|uniref:Uncharacterized protein n=1 Tax=Pleurodeles waltl TaxID=8319 RepID=A0AAV7QP81_PLEWA|nr:hypothetical protein NDU88_007581 [Pleurodeles waltl]
MCKHQPGIALSSKSLAGNQGLSCDAALYRGIPSACRGRAAAVCHTPGSTLTNTDFLSTYPTDSWLNQLPTGVRKYGKEPLQEEDRSGRKSPEPDLETDARKETCPGDEGAAEE